MLGIFLCVISFNTPNEPVAAILIPVIDMRKLRARKLNNLFEAIEPASSRTVRHQIHRASPDNATLSHSSTISFEEMNPQPTYLFFFSYLFSFQLEGPCCETEEQHPASLLPKLLSLCLRWVVQLTG